MGSISPGLLDKFNEFISRAMGLHFPASRMADLERAARSAAKEFGYGSAEDFINRTISSPVDRKKIEALAGHLTVGETYFFREKEVFASLEEKILPPLFEARGNDRRLRVWSAGCSTGEEPYSIAMLLSRLIDVSEWNVTILATDVNPGAIKKAEEGVYTEWSFRGTPEWIRENYFARTGHGRYTISKKIRDMVVFSYLNLAEDAYPSLLNNTNAMDIIFCRNVLMYFSEEKAKKAVKGFYDSLVDGGSLFLGSSEGLRPIADMFNAVSVNGLLLYRKEEVRNRIRPLPLKPLDLSIPAGEVPGISAEKGPRETRFPASAAPSGALEKSGEEPKKPLPSPPSPGSGEKDERYLRAVSAFDAGRYHDAVEDLSELAERGAAPAHSALLARAHANLGSLGLAEQWCRKAIGADKTNPYYYYLLATILQEEGRPDEAAEALKRALYLDHGFALAYLVLGNLMLRKGEARNSARCFKNALEVVSGYDPGHIVPLSDGMTAGRLKEIIERTAFSAGGG